MTHVPASSSRTSRVVEISKHSSPGEATRWSVWSRTRSWSANPSAAWVFIYLPDSPISTEKSLRSFVSVAFEGQGMLSRASQILYVEVRRV